MEGLSAFLKDLGVHSARLSKRLAAYQLLVDAGVSAAYQRERELAGIRGLIAAFPDSEARRRLEEWHCAEEAAVGEQKEEFRFAFGRELSTGLEGSGLVPRGQMPSLRVGMFSVKVDFEAGAATVFWGPEVERLRSGLKLAPAELARTLRVWHESLKAQEKLDTAELLRRMRQAYRRLVTLAGLNDGARVYLIDLLGELVLLMQPQSFRMNPAREKFVEYPRVRFSYDLFRLRRDGRFDAGDARLKLHVANFDATAEKTRALWVPDNEDGDGTHYSYVSFTAIPGEVRS
jgi:hypothetical protein